MKTMNFKTVAAQTAAAACLLGLMMAAQSAMACTVGNWSTNSGNVDAGGPDTSLARYSGLCAMGAPDTAVAWVQDNSPGGINRIRARFYVLNELDSGQSAVVYRGFSDTSGGGPLFTVRLATDGTVRLIDNATATEVQQTASTNWVSVEIDWSQDSVNGTISLSVNGQAPVVNDLLSNTGSSLQAVRLGNLLGAAGSLNFDAYESRRTTAIGRLCVGDGNGDGSIGFPDVTEVFNEVSSAGVELSAGQPDVDENGSVGFPDVTQAFGLVSIAASCN